MAEFGWSDRHCVGSRREANLCGKSNKPPNLLLFAGKSNWVSLNSQATVRTQSKVQRGLSVILVMKKNTLENYIATYIINIIISIHKPAIVAREVLTSLWEIDKMKWPVADHRQSGITLLSIALPLITDRWYLIFLSIYLLRVCGSWKFLKSFRKCNFTCIQSSSAVIYMSCIF